MNRSRFEVSLFCFANPGGTEEQFVDAAAARGFGVTRIAWSRRKPIVSAARALARSAREQGIDILHCHNTYAQLVGALAGRISPVKTIVTFYLWGDFGWKRNALQFADRLSAPLIDRLTAHCEKTLADSIERGIPARRLTLLFNGFDGEPASLTPEQRLQKRAELGAGERDVVLINVSRFWPEKAHEVLLSSLRLIVNRRPETKLWLAGSGPEESRLRELTEQLQLSAHVRFLGYRTDVQELLALADIEAHSSDTEGVAQAICEGMVAGIPIVATRVGGLPEVLRDGVTALLVPPRNPELFAEAVSRLIDDPELGKRLGAGARRFIETEYSLAASTARLEAVYEEMLAR